MIYGTPSLEDVGYNEFTIQVSDGKGGTDNFTFSIEVVTTPIINNPPNITNNASVPTTAAVNSSFSFTFKATDPDSDPLVWSKITGPNWLQIDQIEGRIFGTPSLDDKGSNIFMIEVSDRRGGTDNCVFNITVKESFDIENQKRDSSDSSILWLILVIVLVVVVLILILFMRKKKPKDGLDLSKGPSSDDITSLGQQEDQLTGPMDTHIPPEEESPPAYDKGPMSSENDDVPPQMP
jgi:hypothetical protein